MSGLCGMLVVASGLSLAACTAASGPTILMTRGWQDSIVTSGRAERFDTSHYQTDRRRLMTRSSFLGLITTRGFGTDAEIQPRDSSSHFPSDSLRHGFIAARIITRGNGDYPKFHLPESDTVYLYVRYGTHVVSAAYFVPTHGGPIGSGHLEYIDNHTVGPDLALAKWVFDWEDEMAWMTCEDGGCCRIR